MRRHAVLSMPLSFAIVLVAAIALSGPGPGPARDDAGGVPGATPHSQGTVPVVGGTDFVENPDPVPADAPPVEADEPVGTVLVGRPTVVASGPGETIVDVAERVYGTAELAGALLDLNADVVIEPGRPLPDGTLLRLP